ncbi:hypothetical protein M1O17_03600, partial [Dehalococcoidia bacterium]|nr:hypothetical protein [Dehalococcoidia bacterium]
IKTDEGKHEDGMREKAKMDGEKAKKIDEGKHEDGWRKGKKAREKRESKGNWLSITENQAAA